MYQGDLVVALICQERCSRENTGTDGDVDTADITVGFQNFTGTQSATLASLASTSTQPVPEPSGLILLGLGVASVLVWRRLNPK